MCVAWEIFDFDTKSNFLAIDFVWKAIPLVISDVDDICLKGKLYM